ncbi:MAG TPA: dihydrolipoyl dehydrogenase [Candidatus Cloacimonadota bacterium]|nr:dihydrolipoyl dehydrogenase [Candidatus Cloacimonadota bacterium]HPT72741.1 dihydrolipoyl dehydrogenase [Candidatus Cloacimonadota bacterium]
MKYDLIIIGAGPAGYVAAIRAGQLGMEVMVIDKQYIGGMCLNWGCIPTKAMLESAKMLKKTREAAAFGIDGIVPNSVTFNWETSLNRADGIVKKLVRGIEFLWKKNGVEYLQSEATILDEHHVQANDKIYETENILIATGTKPVPLSGVPSDRILEMEDLFKWDSLPENIAVWGHGSVAIEYTQLLYLIGKKVSLISPSEDLLPGIDLYVTDFLTKIFKRDKIPIMIADKIGMADDKSLQVGDRILPFDKVLNCSNRRAILPSMEIKLDLDERGFIKSNENLQTNYPNIYVAGDVSGKSYHAHTASAQGLKVVNLIRGIQEEFDFSKSPVNIYSEPEIAQIGLTEQQLKAKGMDYKVGIYFMLANGKALTEGNTDGFVRILSEPKYGEVLGVQIVAPNATDMISEASMLMAVEGTVYDIAQTIHAHPTVSEVFMDAGVASTEV